MPNPNVEVNKRLPTPYYLGNFLHVTLSKGYQVKELIHGKTGI